MSTVSWLPSYPKSGNTWMRILLASYLTDAPVVSTKALQAAVPDLHSILEHGRMMPLDAPRPLVVKSHFRPTAEINQLWASDFDKIVYLVRNPRDVLLSAMRHLRIREDNRVQFAKTFIEHRGAWNWLDTYGNWSDHVDQWTDPEVVASRFPKAESLILRYEDLRTDPVAGLGQVLEFLQPGEPIDPDRVRRAVANAELEKLQAAEAAAVNKGRRPEYPFFGQGLRNQSLAVLGDDVEAAYLELLETDEQFGRLTRRFGYDS